MLKKTLYPKTKRVSTKRRGIEITEKLDGSNLCIFRKGEQLIIAQRNNIFVWNSIEENGSQGLYKGLYDWLQDNAKVILENLYDGSGICGEWIQMGKISYTNSDINKKFYVFAKARLVGEELKDYELQNIVYSQDLVPFAFIERNIPECIGLVPVVELAMTVPTKEYLDELYIRYCEGKDRKVEGFIVNNNESITKYVRFKNGKESEHITTE